MSGRSVPAGGLGLDLDELAAVEHAARRILEAHPTLDSLINNAGVMATPESRTVDGCEQQTGVTFGVGALIAGAI